MKHLKNLAIIFVISIVITLIFDYSFGGISSDITALLLNMLYGLIIGGSLSLSGFVTRLIYKVIDIKKNPIKSFVILLVGVFAFIIIDVFAINTIWYVLTQNHEIAELYSNTGFIISSILTILIGIVIFFILLSRAYITRLIKSEEEAQKAKTEALDFKYKTLQSQVNPHFLFNSLNTLSSMISIEPEKAEDFTNHLSKLYRYVLENKDSELVSITDEVLFIENYIVLQKYRFDNNIIFEIDDDIKTLKGQIIPMSLQLLVENAIKHNIVSEQHKLNIKVTHDADNYICVINNIKFKESGKDSFNIGLKNIEDRYSFITDKKCEFTDDGKQFKVRIPIV